MDPLRLLKGLLWFVALSHLAIGLGGLLSPVFQSQMAMLYGARVEWTEPLVYVVRMMGAFMAGLGVAGLFAARDPVRYAGVVMAFAVVMFLRVGQRVVFAGDVQAIFGLPMARNAVNGAFFALLGVSLLVLLAAVMRGASSGRERTGAAA